MIHQSYALILNIELAFWDGRYWADPLWHKDLMLHLASIEALTLVCPARDLRPPADWLACCDDRLTILNVGPLSRGVVLRIPRIAALLWRVIGQHEIVHTGLAGWPFPLGWIAAPIARIRRRFLVIVVESSFWRVVPGTAGVAARLKARVFEAANRLCVTWAAATFFTTDAYAAELGKGARGYKSVSPATWIDDATILSRETILARQKRPDARLLFVGRLSSAKGIDVLLSAIAQSDVVVDILGEGDRRADCLAIAEQFPERVRLLESIPYGPGFFETLDRYTALVVPTLSDEQPRIIADAFARGVPVIASATTGNCGFVTRDHSGWLVPTGDSRSLAAAMTHALADPDCALQYGLNARDRIATHTHSAMHERRAEEIDREFRIGLRPRAVLVTA